MGYTGFMFKRFLTLACAVAVMAAPAFGVEWMTDFAAAKAKAKAENKLILLEFTGSDWCGHCIAMKKDIFDKPEFDAYAKDKFVCLEVDMPHKPKFSEEQFKHNAAICEEYGVRIYPTILVADPTGELVGGFFGGRNTFEQVTKPLDEAVKAGKKLRKAAKLTGQERAKALFDVWVNVPQQYRAHSKAMREEIIKLDTAHETGMKDELKAEEQMRQFYAECKASQGADGLYGVTKKFAPVAMPQNRLDIWGMHAQMLIVNATTVEEVLELKKYMLGLAELEPTCTPKDVEDVKKEFADPEAKLKELLKDRD